LEIIFGSIFNIYHSTPIVCCTTGVGGSGAEVQAHHQKFSFDENPGKIRGNLCKISETFTKSLQI